MSDGMSDARDYGPSLRKHGPPILSRHGEPVKPENPLSIRYLVVRKRDTSQPEVYPFSDLASAEEFFDRASLQWADCYLCEILKPIR